MSSLEDHQVDRTEVYRRISKGLELTVTNRANVVVVRAGVFRDFGVAKSSADRSREGSPPVTATLYIQFFPGDHSGRDTPVPIPNTAVKPARADDSR